MSNNSNLQTPKVVLGGNVFGWSLDEPSSFAILDAAVDHGLHAFDTADVYSHWAKGNKGGESETIIGNWLKRTGKRKDVLLHTKGGAPGAPGDFANAKLTASYLTKAVEGSLRRLQTDHVDLYYLHYDDNVTPPEETLTCLQSLMKQGKIGAVAESNFAPDRLVQSLDVAASKGLPALSAIQADYNLYDREHFESTLQPICQQRKIRVFTYFSLAHGFLSGKYRSEADLSKSAARGGGIAKYLNPRGIRILDALDAISKSHDSTSAQVALAWLLTRPTVSAAVASATNLKQLNDLAAATKLRLNASELTALERASQP